MVNQMRDVKLAHAFRFCTAAYTVLPFPGNLAAGVVASILFIADKVSARDLPAQCMHAWREHPLVAAHVCLSSDTPLMHRARLSMHCVCVCVTQTCTVCACMHPPDVDLSACMACASASGCTGEGCIESHTLGCKNNSDCRG